VNGALTGDGSAVLRRVDVIQHDHSPSLPHPVDWMVVTVEYDQAADDGKNERKAKGSREREREMMSV
jgi:hypothetical protein